MRLRLLYHGQCFDGVASAAVFTSNAYGLRLPTGGLPALLRDSRLFAGRKTEIHAFNDEFRIRLYGV